VTGSPVTAAGTLAGAWNTQTNNYIFAGPATAPAAAPTFRAQVAADVPSLDVAKITTGIFGSERGGTANGFTAFTGPTTAEKTFTLPDASATVLTSNAAVSIAQGGTGQTTASAAFDALSPMTTLGDTIHGGAAGTGTRLAGNTTATTEFLSQTGTGTSSAAPIWTTLGAGDIPVLDASKITTGILGSARGGTGNGFVAFSGPTTSEKTFTLPDASATLLYSGGMSLTSDPTANQGTISTLLHGNAAGQPSFGSVVSADLNITGTTCTNQFVSAISSAVAGTCTTATLASAQFANQGTTTTVLHGNAAGNPSFAAVTSADTTGTFSPSAHGHTLAGADFVNQGTTTTVLHGNTAGNPSWSGISLTADATVNQGTTTTVLHGNAAGQPSFAGVSLTADATVNQGTTTTLLHGNAAGAPSWGGVSLANDTAANQGTTTTVLHGNAAGQPSFSAVGLTTDVTGILGSANGGTGNGFTAFTGPTTAEKAFALPDAAATILTSNAAVTLAQGGTNATSFTAARCVRVNAGGTALEVAATDCAVAGATPALDNLASVAINASLVPGTAATLNLGSAALPWANTFFGNAANQTFTWDVSALAANRTAYVPNANSTLVVADTGTASNFLTAISALGAITKARPALADLSDAANVLSTSTTATGMSAANFCADAGASDTYACNLAPAIASYVTGTHYWFKANTVNTGAASINFNAKGALAIKKLTAGSITTDLADNDIRAGQWVEVVYDGTNAQMWSPTNNVKAIAEGGTGATAKQAAFDALSPVTTRGDMIVRDASNNIRLAKGSQYQVLTGGASDLTWAALALDQATATSGILGSAKGGTGNGFTKFTGPTTAEKTFTLPDMSLPLSGVVFTQTTDVTVANTVSETTVLGTGIGSLTLPAGALTAGKTLRGTLRGYVNATADPTLSVKVYLGAVAVYTGPTLSIYPDTDSAFTMMFDVTCRTVGSSGTVQSQANTLYIVDEEGTKFSVPLDVSQTSTVTIDTTSANVINVKTAWGTADVGNAITITNAVFELLGG
jgi:hypothetical protein